MQTQPVQSLPPGVRMVAGKPYVFDQDAYNAHCAVEALTTAPADLGSLSDDELLGLRAKWLRVSRSGDAAVSTAADRVLAEFARRGMDTAGRRVAVAQAKAA